MIMNIDFSFNLINYHFINLLSGGLVRNLGHYLNHFCNIAFGIKVVINKLKMLACLNVFRELVFRFKLDHSIRYFIISIKIMLICSTFINFLNTFNKTIFISVWIKIDCPFSSINISYFFPAILFSWVIIVDCSELKWTSYS